MLIMLRTDWPADTFRRGGIAFQRGIPVDCDEATIKLVASDLSKSLVIVSATTAKADHGATHECCESFLKKCQTAVAIAEPPAGSSPAEPVSAAETRTTTMAEPPAETPKRKR